MDSNFSYLKKEDKYNSFVDSCIDAENLMNVSYPFAATGARKAMELAVRWLYANDDALRHPYDDNFAALINSYDFRSIVGDDLYRAIDYTRRLGNKATHTDMQVSRNQAILSIRNLFNFTHFIDYCYSIDYEERTFDESILGYNNSLRKSEQEKKKLKKMLSVNKKSLEDLIKENEKLRKENEKIRKDNEKTRTYKADSLNEKDTRKAYIDLDLELNGWEFGKNCLEEVKVSNMKNSSGIGYVDYVLYGDNGKPLGLVEAKRTSESPKLGKVQAQLYADALEIETGVRPIIFYTNGIDYYIWDDKNYPERKISGIYSKDDLESLKFINENKTSLENSLINDNITNRVYQKAAITRTLESFNEGRMKALLVMATGSGKTRTAASIVDILIKNNWVKNILFLADRTVLVKQAKNSFAEYLPDLSLCNLLDNKDDINSRMVFSTYPTMMNAIDNKRGADGERIFTVGHFDLIILDESHRSIYKKYKDIFDYFDAKLLGLTATPVNEIDRNTYRVFDLEDGNPTFAYDLSDAIKDGYLVNYELAKVSETKIMKEGIRYKDLSEEEKEEFESTFSSIDDIPKEKINNILFNKQTIEIVINDLMEKGLKVGNGDKLGKTIIFAANIKHAEAIVEIFNELYPEYKGEFAKAIYHDISYVDDPIDKFKDKNSYPQIAVSVDMLDTGIDIPELVNLVFFKKVRSKAKFWQMIGRGTRLCEDLYGPGIDKDKFLIFDYYYNFEFFEVNGKETNGSFQKSITEKIFDIKIDLIKILQHPDYSKDNYIKYRNELVDNVLFSIKAINKDRFNARMRIHCIDKYSDKEVFKDIEEIDITNLKNEISPLILSTDEDELAKTFDYLMYTIQLAYLEKRTNYNSNTRLIKTAKELSGKYSIDEVRKNKDLLEKIQEEDFWQRADVFEFEKVRVVLRDLIKLIDRKKQAIYYTDFSDEVVSVKESSPIYNVNDLDNYKERVQSYFRKYKDNLSIYKLRNNEKLTENDIKYFEKILFEELGDRTTYTKAYGDKPLLKLVSEIIGMDRQAAKKEFSRFLTDESLNSDQINFVNNIIDYIVKNGSIQKEVLTKNPFNKKGGIIKLFDNNMNIAKDIISTINKINDRLTI